MEGRFKSVLIRDEAALDAVARYLHLNPVRLGALGLSKQDQRRAKVVGCPGPGAALVAQRVVVRQMLEVKYAAAAQGIRRFWRQVERRPECAAFVRRLRKEYQ